MKYLNPSNKYSTLIKGNYHKLVLILIIIICLFFRLYKFSNLFEYNHDEDLNAWVVKDIISDRHLRLIGYETRVPGIFIGPLYFYFLAPFYLLSNFNPLSIVAETIIISTLTIISIYFCFYKMFSRKVALVSAFIYSVSLPMVFFDRWTVPTHIVVLWSVWYIFSLFSILSGNKRAYIYIGALVALIWDIHIALFPLVALILFAYLLSSKKNTTRYLLMMGLVFLLISFPLWLFEIKHNFQQTASLLKYFLAGNGDTYMDSHKFITAIDGAKIALIKPFEFLNKTSTFIVYIFVIMILLLLKIRKVLNYKQMFMLVSWVILVIFGQTFSKNDISDYYFNNIIVISILLVSLALIALFKKNNLLCLLILTIFLFYNLFLLIRQNSLTIGFNQKQMIVNYIANNASANNYPCIGITYITSPGQGVGFRFMLWRSGLKVINPSNDVPVYNITIPTLGKTNEIKFGDMGLIIPPKEQKIPSEEYCQKSENQPLPPLGFN